MLVLSRKKQQSIIIGENIEISVLEIQGDQVRLGISAPKNVSVHRKEVFLEIQEENRRAAEPRTIDLDGIFKNSGQS